MTPLVQPNIEQIAAYIPGKPIEEVERELGIANIIKLASNESPLGPSPKVIDAIARFASQIHRYPDAAAHRLRHRLASELKVAPDHLSFGNGSNELINIICQTFAASSEHAVIGAPSFVCYHLGLRAANVPFTTVPLRENRFWNADDLLEAVRPNTKLLFIANPNNPTGTHLDNTSLRRIASELPERVILVVDEAYVEFVNANDYETAMAMRDLRERLIVLRTFSKSHGLAGIRVGYAVSTPEIGDFINRIRAPFNVNLLAQEAAIAALDDPGHVERYVRLNNGERDRMSEAFTTRGIGFAPSQTNFIFVDCQIDSHEFHKKMLALGVIVRPMPAPINTWQRISLGLPEENDRLLAALDKTLNL